MSSIKNNVLSIRSIIGSLALGIMLGFLTALFTGGRDHINYTHWFWEAIAIAIFFEVFGILENMGLFDNKVKKEDVKGELEEVVDRRKKAEKLLKEERKLTEVETRIHAQRQGREEFKDAIKKAKNRKSSS